MSDQLRRADPHTRASRPRMGSMYDEHGRLTSSASSAAGFPHPTSSPSSSFSSSLNQPVRTRLNSTTGILVAPSISGSSAARARTMSSASRLSTVSQESSSEPRYRSDRAYATIGSRQPPTLIAQTPSHVSTNVSRRTSWTPQKLSQSGASSLADFDPNISSFGDGTTSSSTTASRPATGSRIPSFGRIGSTQPRLGDALLGQRKVSDSSSRPLTLTSSASGSSLTFPARSDSLARSSRLTKTTTLASISSSQSMASIPRSATGTMGPPQLSASQSSDLIGGKQGSTASTISTTLSAPSSNQQPRILPSLPDFGQSFGAALFDDDALTHETSDTTAYRRNSSIAEVDEQYEDGRAPQAPSPPFASSESRITSLATATGKTSNMHLGLRDSPSLSSRFSNFSSALATPEGSDEPNKMLGRSAASATRPSRGDARGSGLGIGLPDLASEARNRQAASQGDAAAGVRARSSAANMEVLQTPEKFGLSSRTPSGTPRSYDRAGQIGIGELATPRWNFSTTALPNWKTNPEVTPLSSSKAAQRRDVSGALTDDGTAPEQISTSVPESHNSAFLRQIDSQKSDSVGPQSRRSEATRHSRSISYSSINNMQRNNLCDPNELLSTLPISPSVPGVPGRHMPLGGSQSLHALAHGYSDKQSQFMAELEGVAAGIGAAPESPSFSISAHAESKYSIAQQESADASLATSTTEHFRTDPAMSSADRSPGIGDLSWSAGETGPFGSEGAGLGIEGSKSMTFGDVNFGNGMGDEDWRQSFDLNAAITDLLNDHDELHRRRQLRDRATSDASEIGKNASGKRLRSDSIRTRDEPVDHSRVQTGSARMPADGQRGLVASSSRRERLTSSGAPAQATSAVSGPTTPLVAQGTPKMSSRSSASLRTKRASSASIGQSLLRGSVPFGHADDYESRLNSREDAAADALRKLDGLGSTPRASRDGKIDLKSPRTSRVPSRPGSAQRRTPGTNSQTSSPGSRSRRSSNYDTSSRSIDKSRASEESIARNSFRASKLVARVRTGDESAASASNNSGESVRTSVYSSPRLRRSQLPPLPQNEITQGSRRASVAQTNTARDASASASPLIGTPVNTRSISRSKRMSGNSDASGIASEGSRHDSATGAYDDSEASRQAAIPPVPPLPKVWEGSRSTSLTSEGFRAISGKSPSITASHSFVSAISGDHSDKIPAPKSPLSPSMQELAEMAALAVRKPSLGLFSDTASRGSSTNDVSLQSAVVEPLEEVITSSDSPTGDASFTASNAAEAEVAAPTQRPKSSSLRRASVASLGRLIRAGQKDKDAEQLQSGVSSQSLAGSTETGTSPKARRTPAFFQRTPKSSDGPAETGAQDSGRLSRKSLLGIAGGLLSRSGSRRTATASNVEAAPRASEVQPHLTSSQPASSPLRRRGQTAGSAQQPSSIMPSTQGPHAAAKAADSVSTSSAALAAQTPSRSTRAVVAGGVSSYSPSIGSRTASPSKSASLSSRIPRVATTKAIPRSAATGPTATEGGSVIRAAAAASSSIPMSKSHHPSLAASMGMVATQSLDDEDNKSVSGSDTTIGTAKHSQASSKKTSSPGGAQISSTLAPILNAYAAAKTPAEIEGVLRRARIAAYSSSLSPSDREVLNNLASRQDRQKADASPSAATKAETTAASADKGAIGVAKPSPNASAANAASSAATSAITDKTAAQCQPSTLAVAPSSTSSGAKLPSPAATTSSKDFGSISVPVRKTRASLGAASAAPRVIKPSALQNPTSERLVKISSSVPTTAIARRSPASSDATGSAASARATPIQDEEERLGDIEMEDYIRRQQARKLAAGTSQAELEKMLEFPEPVAPSRMFSPRQAEVMYGNKMSDFELQEIFNYSEIYYCGQNARRKHMATVGKPDQNHGFDDERGDYNVINKDHLAFRYEIVDLLGRGSFGQVLQCRDHKTGKTVAIKLIRNKKRFHHQALVEVRILENLTKWDPDEKYNVIKMTESFLFRNHLCIATELLSINLYELIKANQFAGFSTNLIRRFTSQVLQSLVLMKHHRIVHCDLKPENILLAHPRKSAIKVIDFGSSCFENEKVYTYIQSRFYRSPEVILGMNYNMAIDIWSLGCIIAELYTGYPLFPGENEQEQLACIMEILGVPDRYLVERSSRKKLFFDSTGQLRPVVNSKGKRRRPGSKTLAQALKSDDELFVDFIGKCLIWDPERRLKPDAAMRHSWIVQGKRLAAVAGGVLGEATGANRSTTVGVLPQRRTAASGASARISSKSSTGTTAATGMDKASVMITPRTKALSTRASAVNGGVSGGYAASPRRSAASAGGIGIGGGVGTPLRVPKA
ncbi:related to putative dual specificity protein kinase pom1 [Melanopsichium pennsylvanicum]|uniref:dual-specificity kinase n=2 Tax=Melanopsichium pennsylvanicum TaxID=63383 RepID=A0AAJ4XSD7_9BASI|nr:related to putative dual specificity protein kinase pom1 (C-terminal fragment) [Melanopsichium pennsylvanicum 4]SNX87041.1 related to putative dual specificity protein kinase pom1 [Melanopsichium pennsylvanicum]